MRIDHIAIWTKNLELMKNFYVQYFNGHSNEKYTNPLKNFESYFISFENGTRIELMHKTTVLKSNYLNELLGLTHIAFNLGSKDAVITLTETLRKNGHRIINEPRTTGDGYFESVVLDIEGNRIELIA